MSLAGTQGQESQRAGSSRPPYRGMFRAPSEPMLGGYAAINLSSSMCLQMCAVELGIAQALPGGTFSASGQALHWIRAVLTSDGSREYKVDGKARTGQQVSYGKFSRLYVQAFLHAHHLYWDSDSCVIRQAQVTRLADKNDHHEIANVISGASGMLRWNIEAAKAKEEIKASQKALQDIRRNLEKLVSFYFADGNFIQNAVHKSRVVFQQEHGVEVGAEMIQRNALAMRLEVDIEDKAEHLSELLRKNIASLQQAIIQARDKRIEMQRTIKDKEGECITEEGRERQLVNILSEKVDRVSDQQTKCARIRKDLTEVNEEIKWQQGQLERVEKLQKKAHLCVEQVGSFTCAEGELLAKMAQQEQVLMEHLSDAQNADDVSSLEERVELAELQVLSEEEEMSKVSAQLEKTLQALKEMELKHDRHLSLCQEAQVRVSKALQDIQDIRVETGLSEGCLLEENILCQIDSCSSKACEAQSKLAFLQRLGYAFLPGQSAPLQLHQCFRFRPQQEMLYTGRDMESSTENIGVLVHKPLIRALSMIAGSALTVIICSTQLDASKLLDDPCALSTFCSRSSAGSINQATPSSVRIWPLDLIRSSDRKAQLQHAVRALRKGLQAWIPLDLIAATSEQYVPALHRAFGNMLIAADDAAAAQLSAELGQSCVTIEGLVSRPGAISGGWLGEGLSQSEMLMLRKLDYQAAEEDLEEAQASLERWRAVYDRVQDAESCLHEGKASLDISKYECEQAIEQLTAAQQKVRNLEAEAENLSATLNTSRQELTLSRQSLMEAKSSNKECLKQGTTLMENRRAEAGALLENLRSQLSEVKDGKEDAEAGLEEIACVFKCLCAESKNALKKKGEVTESCISVEAKADSAVQCSLNVEDSFQSVPLQKRLDLHVQQMTERLLISEENRKELMIGLEAEQDRGRTAVRDKDAALHEIEALRCRQNEFSHQISALNDILKTVEAEKCILEERKEYYETVFKRTLNTYPFLQRRNPHPSAGPASDALGNLADRQSDMRGQGLGEEGEEVQRMPEQAREIESMLKLLVTLQAQRLRLRTVCQLSDAEEVLHRDRVKLCEVLKQRLHDLKSAVEALESGLATAKQQVIKANEDTYKRVAARFSMLCSMLLPSMRITLEKSTDHAHEGLSLNFSRNLGEACLVKGNVDTGKVATGSLEQLSGGQRSLVSIALLMSAAQEGSHSTVMLLDEADAALDEHNQSSLAALLKHVSHGAGAQIICVSHNRAFQRDCDTTVHITRSDTGESSVIEESGMPLGPADAYVMNKCKKTANHPTKKKKIKGNK
ncbi:hypothetical protein CEUSTIGMA_g7276.t1 [Chlamydomonas eustigma]|uniref:RecF/RecN/SMC N-terminal domain-containing protein n=1 Tax=Chlamydomonas eustigma TaxID=1157962 RepID=A0A250X9W5_9CHLO|nr:hypothetical protein CEUSTIGMA_g7276.t1 [Chlamydomonas eustigma]|eukprot:GAX79836.1 hypothetical protein CEUSTIGMA_g7276.t1 [Chlamydomonas eustigma]